LRNLLAPFEKEGAARTPAVIVAADALEALVGIVRIEGNPELIVFEAPGL
jgi:hypothetical protein